MHLRHIHLPSIPAAGTSSFPTYALAACVQEHFRRRLLDFKDSADAPRSAPPPTLLSFTPAPTYTLGRRQRLSLPREEVLDEDRLEAPLRVSLPPPPPRPHVTGLSTGSHSSVASGSHNHHRQEHQDEFEIFDPAVVGTPRGGLATYHGPGQVVLWAVTDMRSLMYRPFSVRKWARALEDTTIAVLARLYGLQGLTTEDPGVWLSSPPSGDDSTSSGEKTPRKIAAMGVAVRRHVSSLGMAINVSMPGTVVGSDGTPRAAEALTADEESDEGNPWLRFVPCGLEGKGVTSVAGALGLRSSSSNADSNSGPAAWRPGVQERVVAAAWADELARTLRVEGVEMVGRDEVRALVRACTPIFDRDDVIDWSS